MKRHMIKHGYTLYHDGGSRFTPPQEPELLRCVYLRPYRDGEGPTFSLRMWATSRSDHRGQTLVQYEFVQHSESRQVLFAGGDFSPSPLHALGSDATIAGLLTFLTLRPGDTDAEYFAHYTPAQREFAEQHAEAVACAALDRFGED